MKMNIIEFMILKYYNNIAKYIKFNLINIILIDILIKKNNFHKYKF